jgi:hypothetical protein
MRTLTMAGSDLSVRAEMKQKLALYVHWAASGEEAEGTIVIARTRQDWALLNRLDNVVAILAFDRRYADEEGGARLPIFYVEDLHRIKHFFLHYDSLYQPFAAAEETQEYDGCLW